MTTALGSQNTRIEFLWKFRLSLKASWKLWTKFSPMAPRDKAKRAIKNN